MTVENKIFPMRIAKRIAASGFCSRREAERYIKSHKVLVNNKIIDSLGMQINKKDKITVNGITIKNIPNTKLYMFNKSKGCIVSENDPQNRKTIYDIIPNSKERLMYIGRLDFNSEGLLLLTNNGQLKRYFELPKNKIQRCYRVKVYGNTNNINKKMLEKGISIDGIFYGKIYTNIIKTNAKSSWIEITLTEGKNREIRKILYYFGLKVNDLIRVSFGPYHLDNLEKNKVKELEIKHNILRQVNID